MNLEERIVKLEKSNKNYKIVIALSLCMFMVSAKDIFIKDEIRANKIYAKRIILEDSDFPSDTKVVIEDFGISLMVKDTNYSNRWNQKWIKFDK